MDNAVSRVISEHILPTAYADGRSVALDAYVVGIGFASVHVGLDGQTCGVSATNVVVSL